MAYKKEDGSGLYKNMAYESDLPPDYKSAVVQQPVVVAMPPPDTQGIFLSSDVPVVVQPNRAEFRQTRHANRGDYIGHNRFRKEISSSDAPPIGPEATLNYLKNVTKLQIKQKIELVEIVTGFDTANRFTIFDENNQVLFYALEDSDCLVRQCCGPARPFEIKILDIYQNEVMRIDRPLACQCCLCYCCLMNVEVFCPRGNIVGKVQQEFSWFYPKFGIENAIGEKVLKLDGPCWTCSCGGDITFKVTTADGTEVADITKTWAGICQEYFTDADNFCISFQRDLDPAIKATLLGAIFLLDVMYFERKK